MQTNSMKWGVCHSMTTTKGQKPSWVVMKSAISKKGCVLVCDNDQHEIQNAIKLLHFEICATIIPWKMSRAYQMPNGTTHHEIMLIKQN